MLDTLLAVLRPALGAAFSIWSSPVTWLEIVAFWLGVAMVLANMRVDPVGWPLAIASSLLYALLFADSKLYGEASLQIFFVAVSLWGWWQWLRGRAADGQALRVGTMSARGRWVAALATLAGWPLLALGLKHATDSTVPWLDALPTVGSVTATVLLGRKRVENWPLWVAVNVFSVGLFAYKGLWLTVLLYAVFAVLAVAAWREWRKLSHA
jgi:nicotinamide mononucleotide transporter